MKLIKAALRTITADLSHQRRYLSFGSFSAPTSPPGSGAENRNAKPSESMEDFQQRIFGGSPGNDQNTVSFYKKLDKMEKSRGRMGLGPNMNGSSGGRDSFEGQDDLDESFSTLSDGLNGRLKKAARYFEYDPEEVEQDDYSFRPDAIMHQGDTYDLKDLDLTKPGVDRPPETWDFEVTTEEVLRKADFRNVRFLANFITDAGIIIKRSHATDYCILEFICSSTVHTTWVIIFSQGNLLRHISVKFPPAIIKTDRTGISAKAQRKVAREIKIARAFGLMPFTTMGQFPFVAGKTREELESEDEFDHTSYMTDDGSVDSELLLDPAKEPVVDP